MTTRCERILDEVFWSDNLLITREGGNVNCFTKAQVEQILHVALKDEDISVHIPSCPHCGTTELLCGYPKHCASDRNPENGKIWFACKFVGRLAGAIDKVFSVNQMIQAGTKEQAKDLLYERFEHITNLTIKENLIPK